MNMHLVPVDRNSTSPFDAIKNTNPDGREYWSARDLMPMLGYGDKWQNFAQAIERAKLAAEVQGHDVNSLFTGVSKKSGGRPQKDYELARFACYLVAMNGDPRKPEIAAAMFYFAIKTREAEVRPATPELPKDYASALRELASAVETKEIAERQEREQRELAEKRARAIEAQAPAVAKAQAHSGVTEWKGKQNFAREVQQWGDLQGLDIKQQSVLRLLARKGMYIAAGRADSGQVKRDAVRAGWGKNEKGVADNGHAYTRPLISPKGQDVAWKWIIKAVAEHGQELNPKESAA
ncbi:hypothetical protein GWO57_08355 [Corynebacterium macginleyi]|uniref:BRO family protein n=1 Tax=Corynebacterium macginleyi TaxID=38290 RepID=UPI001909F1AF|nr:BRO family protein [Corynebacterium macginleyi]MBK4144646.1 hypothetical protein [Corynebacterium macginleyi]